MVIIIIIAGQVMKIDRMNKLNNLYDTHCQTSMFMINIMCTIPWIYLSRKAISIARINQGHNGNVRARMWNPHSKRRFERERTTMPHFILPTIFVRLFRRVEPVKRFTNESWHLITVTDSSDIARGTFTDLLILLHIFLFAFNPRKRFYGRFFIHLFYFIIFLCLVSLCITFYWQLSTNEYVQCWNQT